MSLPTVGTISYGTATFDSFVKSSITANPIWDEAGRTIVCWEHLIKVKGYVYTSGSSSTDATMAALLQQLISPCAELHYDNGKGYGGPRGTGLTVNGAGSVQDVDYGPKPRVISFAPMGGGVAVGNVGAFVEWECTTRIPLCYGAVYNNAVMAFNYEISYDIDWKTALTRINYSGYLQIPATRQRGTRQIIDNADSYRDKVATLPPEGYRRENMSFRLDKSKTRLDFSWSDQELTSPLPAGISDADASHSVRWQRSSLAWFSSQISATFVVPAGVDTNTAMLRFKLLVAQRIAKLKDGKVPALKKEALNNIFLDSFDITEQLFTSQTWRFSMTYRIIGAKLDEIYDVSNLGKPFKLFTHEQWQKSMAETSQNIRGAAKVQFRNQQDGIVDLCLPTTNMAILYAQPGFHPELIAGGIPGGQAKLRVVEKLPEVGGKAAQRNRPLVDPDKSWIMYQVATQLIEDDRVIVHKPLKGAENVQAAKGSGFSSGGANAFAEQTSPGQAAGEQATVEDAVQRLSAPTYKLRIFGRALRLGYRVPTPRLTTAGGVKLTQESQQIAEGQGTAVSTVPIFFKTFDITYIVPKTPTDIPIPENPAFQTVGES